MQLRSNTLVITGSAEQFGHIGQINAAVLTDGYCQCFAGRVHAGNDSFRTDGALGEHVGFGFQLLVFIEVFEGAEQVVGRIILKKPPVFAVVEQTVFCSKSIVSRVQLCLCCLDVLIRGIVQLLLDKLVDDLAQLHHSGNAPLSITGQFHLRHHGIFTVVHLAVHHSIAEILHIRVSRESFAFCLCIRNIWCFDRSFRVLSLNMLYCFGKLVNQHRTFNGHNSKLIPPILGAFGGQLSQNHLRVFHKIAVERQAIFRFAKLHPCRFPVDRTVTLLQEDNVGNHFSSGICLERIVRQTDSTQQISTFRNVLAGGAVFAVQRITGGHKSHDAARTHLVDGLGKEIVVDGKSQLVVCLVIDPILTKRHIAHGKVVEIPAVGSFKTRHGNIGLRVQLLGNAAGDAVQFHTIQTAVLHGVRQHPEEIADTHAGFQNVTTAEAHFLHGIINGMDNGRAGIVGIQNRPTGGGVLVLRKQSLQLGIFTCPTGFVRVKGICQTAPTDVLRQHFLLLGRSTTVFFFQTEQRFDGFDVPGVLLLCATLAQMLICDVKIPGGFRRRFCVEGFIQGCGIRESLHFAVNDR